MSEEIKQQLDRIERYSLLAAKNVLCFDDVALLTGLSRAICINSPIAIKFRITSPMGNNFISIEKK